MGEERWNGTAVGDEPHERRAAAPLVGVVRIAEARLSRECVRFASLLVVQPLPRACSYLRPSGITSHGWG